MRAQRSDVKSLKKHSITQNLTNVDKIFVNFSKSPHKLIIRTSRKKSFERKFYGVIFFFNESGGKTSACTGTRGGSETSLNMVVYENVKVYMNKSVKFLLDFL